MCWRVVIWQREDLQWWGWGWAPVYVWKACKLPSQNPIHGNEANRMKERGISKERNLDEEEKALTNDLSGEPDFVFYWMISDALPARKGSERAQRRTVLSLSSSFSACNIKGSMDAVAPITAWKEMEKVFSFFSWIQVIAVFSKKDETKSIL